MKSFDLETFLHEWRSGKEISTQIPIWIERSSEDSHLFYSQLFSYHEKRCKASSSSIWGKEYNFYEDCILRYKEQKNVALRVIDKSGDLKDWTYEDLHFYVNAQVDLWVDEKVQAGRSVAIVLKPGIEYIVSLLTALRLNLSIYYFPLETSYLSTSYIQKTIETLQPNWVIFNPKESQISFSCPTIAVEDLLSKEYTDYSPVSFYAADMPVFSMVDAQTAYFSALRDGIIALNLESNVKWARPLSYLTKEEPYCTLIALLMGATIVHVSDEDLINHPQMLRDVAIDVLGISPFLRELWSEKGCFPKKKLQLCYRTPLDGSVHTWKNFLAKHELKKIPLLNLVIDGEQGGGMLFSLPTAEKDHFFVQPGMGEPWSLTQVNGNGEKSVEKFGIFNFQGRETPIILSQLGDDWMISGTMKPLHKGCIVPIDRIEESLSKLPFISYCCLLLLPDSSNPIEHRLILLIFIDPDKKKNQEWDRQIQDQIAQEIGKVFVPEKIVYFPLFPHLKEGKVDRQWCFMQYIEGLLSKKSQLPVYHHLNMLKMSLAKEEIYA